MTKFGWMELNMINSSINSMHPNCVANDTAHVKLSILFTRAYDIAAFVNGILKEAGQSV